MAGNYVINSIKGEADNANKINTKEKCERFIENSGQCVSARYDVQILTIPAPRQRFVRYWIA